MKTIKQNYNDVIETKIKEFYKNHSFTDKEKEAIKEYEGREVYLLYQAFINTDLELTEQNLYLVFKANMVDEIDE